MGRIDFNCFVGTWPFHYVRNSRFSDLRALHAANQIDYGYVSSTEAIFYHDPYEADVRLAAEIRGSDYQHVVTLNPTLPGCIDTLKRMTQEFPVAGVRILPGFHDYRLTDPLLENLYQVMCEYKLPLFLTLRMEDERAAYLFKSKEVPIWDIDLFVSTHMDIPIMICNCRNQELSWLAASLPYRPHVSIDCSGLKNGLFGIDAIYEEGAADKLVYGSLAPIFCMKSTILSIETADIPDKVKRDIFSGKRFLNALHTLEKTREEEFVVLS